MTTYEGNVHTYVCTMYWYSMYCTYVRMYNIHTYICMYVQYTHVHMYVCTIHTCTNICVVTRSMLLYQYITYCTNTSPTVPIHHLLYQYITYCTNTLPTVPIPHLLYQYITYVHMYKRTCNLEVSEGGYGKIKILACSSFSQDTL